MYRQAGCTADRYSRKQWSLYSDGWESSRCPNVLMGESSYFHSFNHWLMHGLPIPSHYLHSVGKTSGKCSIRHSKPGIRFLVSCLVHTGRILVRVYTSLSHRSRLLSNGHAEKPTSDRNPFSAGSQWLRALTDAFRWGAVPGKSTIGKRGDCCTNIYSCKNTVATAGYSSSCIVENGWKIWFDFFLFSLLTEQLTSNVVGVWPA